MSPSEFFSQLLVPATSPAVMVRERRPSLPGTGLVLAGCAFVAVVVTHLIDFGADDLRIPLFNADSDASWSHLLTAAVLVTASVLMVITTARAKTQRALLAAATAIFVFLTFDEISSLHVRIDSTSWGKLVYTPVLVALSVVLLRIAGRFDGAVAIRAGLVTLFVSFGIHIFGPHIVNALGWGSQSWEYQTKVALKEGTEIAGWVLVMYGLVPGSRRLRAEGKR